MTSYHSGLMPRGLVSRSYIRVVSGEQRCQVVTKDIISWSHRVG